jgi:hypothetical protein
VTVVAALNGNDRETTGGTSRCLDRNVDRLAAGHAEYDSGKRIVHRCGQTRGKLRSLGRHEVMIADVELAKRIGNSSGHPRIAVPKAEDATVAMAVDESKLRVSILEPNALTPPHHHLKAHALVVRELVGRDVLAKHSDELVGGFEWRGQWFVGHR